MNAKHLLFPLLFGGACSMTECSSAQTLSPKSDQSLYFIENKGQITDQHGNSRHDINYRVGGSGFNIFVGSGQLHYQWGAPASKESGGSTGQRIALYRMDVSLLGADPQAVAVAELPQPFYERYYFPQFGETGAIAHSFQKITYKEVYPNIDWVMYVKDNTVEYDFVVRPGGKVSDIKLQYGGSTNLTIDKAGRLAATTPMGSITEAAPISYEQNSRNLVSSFFTLNNNTVSFITGDYSGTLVIDPTLSWSTYYGGAMDETIKNGSVTGDPYGNGYLAGYTLSTTNIATTGSFKDTLTAGTDGFIVKFSGSGLRKWATYYGGSSTDQAWVQLVIN